MNQPAVRCGRIRRLVRRGGRDIKKMARSHLCAKRKRDSAQHQITEGTGWSLTNHVAECVLEPWLVSDHPVCGASVASRLFIDAAATPSSRGGECGPEQFANSFTRSHTLGYCLAPLRGSHVFPFSVEENRHDS